MIEIVADSTDELSGFLTRFFICPIDFDEMDFSEKECPGDCYGCLISNYGLKVCLRNK